MKDKTVIFLNQLSSIPDNWADKYQQETIELKKKFIEGIIANFSQDSFNLYEQSNNIYEEISQKLGSTATEAKLRLEEFADNAARTELFKTIYPDLFEIQPKDKEGNPLPSLELTAKISGIPLEELTSIPEFGTIKCPADEEFELEEEKFDNKDEQDFMDSLNEQEFQKFMEFDGTIEEFRKKISRKK